MSTEENKLLVRRQFDEIWNGGNWAIADELYAPGGAGPGVAAEILHQGSQLIQGGQPVAAQRADGLLCISQSRLGQVGRPLDRGAQAFADRLPGGHLAGALQLDGQAGQRVGEHVVQLAGDAAPLGQRGRSGLALACVLELGQQQLGAVLALAAAPDELARHRQQQAQQRRGDGGLGTRVPVRPTATASAAVIAPAVTAATAGGSLTVAIQTPMLAAISTGPFGCKTANATPQPPGPKRPLLPRLWPKPGQAVPGRQANQIARRHE